MSIPKKSLLTKSYLPQLLAFILADEVCNNYFLSVYSASSGDSRLPDLSKSEEVFFYFIFLVIPIFCSPIQSGYSDFYCRKKSLLISLGFSALSVIPAFLYFQHLPFPIFLLTLMALIKGAVGNNLPLAWAGIADTQDSNVRLSLGLSTSAIALGYLVLLGMRSFLTDQHVTVAIFLLFVILFFVAYKLFFDLRDKKGDNQEYDRSSIIRDISLLVNDFLRSRRFCLGLATFLFWEISFYSAHMLDVDLKIQAFKGLTLTMVLGYLVGVFFLWRLSWKSDEDMIKIGYAISIISFIPIFILFPFVENIKNVMVSCYFFYSLGAAFLAPSLFSILSKERHPHEQGKIYGLLDSTDTIAFLAATAITMFFYWLSLSQIVIIIASFSTLIASWWPYAEFKKNSSFRG